MTTIGGNKRASRAVEVTSSDVTPPDEAMTRVYVVSRSGGGIVLAEADVPTSSLRYVRRKEPEALAIVAARLSGWVADRFGR